MLLLNSVSTHTHTHTCNTCIRDQRVWRTNFSVCLLCGLFPEDFPAKHNLNTPNFLAICAIISLWSHSAGFNQWRGLGWVRAECCSPSTATWAFCSHSAEVQQNRPPIPKKHIVFSSSEAQLQRKNHSGFHHAEQTGLRQRSEQKIRKGSLVQQLSH